MTAQLPRAEPVCCRAPSLCLGEDSLGPARERCGRRRVRVASASGRRYHRPLNADCSALDLTPVERATTVLDTGTSPEPVQHRTQRRVTMWLHCPPWRSSAAASPAVCRDAPRRRNQRRTLRPSAIRGRRPAARAAPARPSPRARVGQRSHAVRASRGGICGMWNGGDRPTLGPRSHGAGPSGPAATHAYTWSLSEPEEQSACRRW